MWLAGLRSAWKAKGGDIAKQWAKKVETDFIDFIEKWIMDVKEEAVRQGAAGGYYNGRRVGKNELLEKIEALEPPPVKGKIRNEYYTRGWNTLKVRIRNLKDD